MTASTYFSEDKSFLQNLNAARESALISRLKRTKEVIDKMKVTLSTLKIESREYQNVEQSIKDENGRYFNIMNQLNKLRGRQNGLNENEVKLTESQQINYFSDSNQYTNVSMHCAPRKKYDYKEEAQIKTFTNAFIYASKSQLIDTIVF